MSREPKPAEIATLILAELIDAARTNKHCAFSEEQRDYIEQALSDAAQEAINRMRSATAVPSSPAQPMRQIAKAAFVEGFCAAVLRPERGTEDAWQESQAVRDSVARSAALPLSSPAQEQSIRAHVPGCRKSLSVPVDRCSCGGRDFIPDPDFIPDVAVPSSPVAEITVNDFVCAVGEMTNEDALQRVKALVRAEDASSAVAEATVTRLRAGDVFAISPSTWDAIGLEVDRLRAAGLILKPSTPSAPAAADDRKDP